MTHEDYLHLFNCTDGVGRKTLQKGIDAGHTPEALWKRSDHLSCFSKKQKEEIQKQKKAEVLTKTMDLLRNSDIRSISYLHSEYPKQLLELPDKPLLLYVRGNISFDFSQSLAVVGTRKCSSYGKTCGMLFTAATSKEGVTIISGLARGIDGVAHSTALEHNGHTIAVLGSGLNHIYPASHKKLAEEIIANGGALISEYPPNTRPQPGLFPERNRIVAGLSKATLVVEAPKKSGSMITAGLALDYNRDVFAVPGNIFSDNFSGNHSLISNGAKIIAEISDILEEFGHTDTSEGDYIPQNNFEKQILDCVNIEAAISTELLADKTDMSFAELQKTLSILEIHGIITKDHLGNILRSKK